MGKIKALRIELGWTQDQFLNWLAGRRFKDGRAMTMIQSSHDAGAVIELLKAVLVKHQAARTRPEGQRNAADAIPA